MDNRPPVSISYDDQADAVYIYLKGSIAPGESATTLQASDHVHLDFDAAGHLIGIELLSGELLHPALMPFAKRLRPAHGEI